jgi:DNA polymerase III delta' subunit
MKNSLKPLAQTEATEKLLKMKDNLPQALLCVGPQGVGKKRTIKYLFQVLHCLNLKDEEPCGECSQCKKIFDNNHVDLIEITPHNNQIHVDDLREMKKKLYFAPMDGLVRFIILDDAHTLNVSSANSILKTLEEPPSHTRFFLITHEPSLLLPTILSRCQFLYFKPLDTATLETLIKAQGYVIPQNLKSLIFDLLGGGLQRVSTLLDSSILEFLELSLEELQKSYLKTDWQEIVKFSDRIDKDKIKIEILLDLIVWHTKNLLLKNLSQHELKKIYKNIETAFEAVFLQSRLNHYANQKLIALKASEIFLSKNYD